eukprot:TRINITY_DN4891_c0_g1_i1.p1 TRINITY_DN4891_c0_g1~~TRINITY_DN4891_c0_g1_i1.p1  ORF type:complete len:505 (+),score=170.84 TRINITY_DN4891_c0_g1_i1:72-1586(+)
MLATAAAALAAATAAGTQPNILLMVADDLGYADTDIQTPNSSVALTPNLRKLAHGGVRFTNHHVQPFCSPTRATLMTGRYVLRYGLQNSVIKPPDAFAVPRNETLLPQNLKDAGYYTAQIGKWHLGLHKEWALPMNRGFDEQYGYWLGAEDYWTHVRSGGLDWHREGKLVTDENGTYSADLLGKAATEFITRRGPLGPWFMYLPFQSVHAPLEAPEKYLKMYPRLSGSQQVRTAMVTAMDDQVGEIVKTLADTQQTDRTVIVFTADNGAPYGDALFTDEAPREYGLVGSAKQRPPPGGGSPPHGAGGGSNWPLSGWKHWLFEGGVRSTAFISAPQLAHRAGEQHSGLFHSADWLPTLVGLAGGETAKNLPLDGKDIWQALLSGAGSPHDEIPINIAACGSDKSVSEVDGPQAAIIVGDLKLLVDCFWRDSRDVSVDHVQLYNLTSDPSEATDLAASRPDDVKRLADRLAYWEAQSVVPYRENGIDAECGVGKPHGTPPHWDPWC